jgi:hypothetical protein
MKKMASIFVIMSISSSAFALSPIAVTAALKVTKVANIVSVTEDKESPTPRCPCELIKIQGADESGQETSQTVIVEHGGDGQIRVVKQ